MTLVNIMNIRKKFIILSPLYMSVCLQPVLAQGGNSSKYYNKATKKPKITIKA